MSTYDDWKLATPLHYDLPDNNDAYDRMTLEAAEAVAVAAVVSWEDMAGIVFPEAARAQLVVCVEDFYRKLDGHQREMFGRMDGIETTLPDRNPNPPERYQTPDSEYDRMTLEAAEAVAVAAVVSWEDMAGIFFPEAARAQLLVCVEDFYRKLDGHQREMFGRMDGIEEFSEREVWLEQQDEIAAEARYFGRDEE